MCPLPDDGRERPIRSLCVSSPPKAALGGGKVTQTRDFFTVTLVEQLDCKKSTSIRCDGFPYFRSEGVERCGSVRINERPGLS